MKRGGSLLENGRRLCVSYRHFPGRAMNKKKLSVVVISTTPFAEDGSIDEEAYRRQLRRLGAAGCSVYFAGSGTTEAYTFTPEERDRALSIAVEELKGKVQVRAMGG